MFPDDEEDESEHYESEEPSEEKGGTYTPTIEYYHKTYAISCGGDDQRAVRIFRDYESHEKLRRLQMELQLVKDGKVSGRVCDRLIGKKRKGRYNSYERWGQLMLLWLTSKKK